MTLDPGFTTLAAASARLGLQQCEIEHLVRVGLVAGWYEADALTGVRVEDLLDHGGYALRERWRASDPHFRPEEP